MHTVASTNSVVFIWSARDEHDGSVGKKQERALQVVKPQMAHKVWIMTAHEFIKKDILGILMYNLL